MPFESLKAGIALLLEQASETPEDAHGIYEELREKLAEMRGLGLPLPDDLVALEKGLAKDLEKKN